jgi:hypothetical protein
MQSSPRSKRQAGRGGRTQATRASSRRGGQTRSSSRATSRGRSATRAAGTTRGRAATRARTSTRSRSTAGGGAGSAQSTQNLEEIRAWAEERGGKPATVKSTSSARDGAGILRIDFPGYSGGDSLEEISWDEWYEKFQENNLTFLYQDRTKDGKESRFFKLVCEPKAGRKSGAKSSKG